MGPCGTLPDLEIDEETYHEYLRAAVDASETGLILVDASGRICFANPEIERLLGYGRAEITRMHVDDLVPASHRPSHAGHRAGFHESARTRAMGGDRDLFAVHRDGSLVAVRIGLRPVDTPRGELVLASVVDDRARRSAEAQFRIAVESSPSGMIMVDQDGRIVLINREVELLFGFDREELLGGPVGMLVPEEVADAHPVWRQSFFAAPERRRMGVGRELRGRRKDGSTFPVEIGLNPIQYEGGTRVLCSVVDITERKQAEYDRQHAQRVESIGTLAGGIAHEFNNVLMAISVHAELCEGELTRGVKPSLSRERIQSVLQSVERGRHLVDGLLRFSRTQELHREPMRLGPVLQAQTEILQAIVSKEVTIELDVVEDGTVLADATAIEQVLTNLINNATHAMTDRGTVQVSLVRRFFGAGDSLPARLPAAGHYMELRVQDDGAGMDPETVVRIFDPFFTTKAPGVGTGLGLTVVHGILQEHQGSITVESELGRGTTFTCHFPVVAETPRTVRGEDPEEDAALPVGRVMLAEDESVLREGLTAVLRGLNLDVVVARDGTEAMNHLHETGSRLDLLVLDHAMPGHSGVEVAQEARSVAPGVPILFISGRMPTFPQAPADLGIRKILAKPFSVLAFQRAVRDVLDLED